MTIGKKEPVRVASVASAFAPFDEAELPLTPEQVKAGATVGDIVPVRPLDAIGYELKLLMDNDPDSNGGRVWELTQRCLPTVDEQRIKGMTPQECGVIVLIASGRIKEVEALAEKMAGNGKAPVTTAEPEPGKSSTLSDSSASESGESAVAT